MWSPNWRFFFLLSDRNKLVLIMKLEWCLHYEHKIQSHQNTCHFGTCFTLQTLSYTTNKLGDELGGVTMQDPRTFLKGFDNSKIESLKIGIFS
jgi:hypothetical protein